MKLDSSSVKSAYELRVSAALELSLIRSQILR